ncbi:MAG: hypothetical protein H0T46_31605 [Deltaproteobacteria bacterium]|nr:hypothetical protein [Deltaproteobacteria bacterium]
MSIAEPAPSLSPLALALAAAGPIAIGGILAVHGTSPTPLVAVPAVVFGVVAATAPALYIATAAAGTAPSLATVVRAFGVAIGAFGIALAGLLLPAAFLSLSSTSPSTTFVVATAALGGAGLLALRRLGKELAPARVTSLTSGTVFLVWSAATLGIAGRLWWDLAKEVMS